MLLPFRQALGSEVGVEWPRERTGGPESRIRASGVFRTATVLFHGCAEQRGWRGLQKMAGVVDCCSACVEWHGKRCTTRDLRG